LKPSRTQTGNVQSKVLEALVVTVFVVALACSAAVIRAVDPEMERAVVTLRSRFLYGVPWGTLVVVGIILGVYLFVQGGHRHWNHPVTISFRAWSYLYPTGMLAAGFAHDGPGHLIANLTGTVVLGPIAEYVWGHYPVRRRSQADHSIGAFPFEGTVPAWVDRHAWFGTPWIRALVIFPGVVLLSSVWMSLFSIGPVMGFSGTVFAFGGFALTRYPLTTLVALFLQSVVRTIYSALTEPVVTASISGSPPSPPVWATIAVQGHALGIVTGILLGIGLLWYRNQRPRASRLWLAVFVFGMTKNLWAVYWFAGEGRFVLFRALGVALVAVLALLIVAAVAAPTRPWVPDADDELIAALSWRSIALVGLLVGATFITAPAIYPNLGTVGTDTGADEQSVTVGDYEVLYGEHVRNRQIPAIDVPGLDGQSNQTTSGVVILNEQRHIWTRSVSTQRLKATGTERIPLGGIGWRETVTARLARWSVAGNHSVYNVWLRPASAENRTHVFASSPSTADLTIDNRTVTLVPDDGEIELRVERENETLGRTRLPERNESVTAGGLTFTRTADGSRPTLLVERGGTSIRIAARAG
jgi:hypothetical protein